MSLARDIAAQLAERGWPEADGEMMDAGFQVAIKVRVSDEPRYWAKRLPLDEATADAFDAVFRAKVAVMDGWSAPE